MPAIEEYLAVKRFIFAFSEVLAHSRAPWARNFGYLCLHPRNLDSSNCPYLHPPLHVSRDEILHFKYPCFLAVNRMATRTFRRKINKQAKGKA